MEADEKPLITRNLLRTGGTVATEKKLDRCLHQFYKKLNRVLDRTCPKKKRSTKVKANVWYNKNLKEMAKRIKKAYNLS